MIAAAESCTGGLLAANFCAVPRASDIFSGAIIAYSDAAKINLLGLDTNY